MSDNNINRTPYAQNSEEGQLDFIINTLINKTINTCDIVEVVAVDKELKTVDVKPLVTQLAANDVAIAHSIIHGLPYFRYQASAAAIIITPVIGDKGICVYAQNDISGVLEKGAEAPPTSYRKFDYADGFYFGLVAKIAKEPTSFIEITDDDILLKIGDNTSVKMVDGEISLDAQSIKISGDVEFTGSIKSNNKTIDSTHTHGGVQAGSSNTLTPNP